MSADAVTGPVGPSGPTGPAAAAPGRRTPARAGATAWAVARTRSLVSRPEGIALLIVTAVLYLVGLNSSEWANSFYSAAVQAGSQSWWAFLWGASDMAASITVDKPPMSIWVMALSVRLFGLSSWSILVPEALMGVATVWIVWRTVSRYAGRWPGFWAGVAMATTPVAVLMFRFNNPDALLLLLLTGAVAAGLRATEKGRLRWLVLAGVLVGFGFLTKQLQAFLVLPAIAVTYLAFGPRTALRRLWHGVIAMAAMVVAGGWWVALTVLIPSGSRPWIGGSQTDSFLELTFSYNGLGRITGDQIGSVGGGGGGGQMGPASGTVGILRLFGSELGGQASWLIPASLILAVAGLWALRRRPRTDMLRGALVSSLVWFLVTAVVFSYMSGIFHAYYTVALAAPIAMTAALGWAGLRQGEVAAPVRHIVEAGTVAVTVVWAVVLMRRSSAFAPWLVWVVAITGLVAVVALLMAARGISVGLLASRGGQAVAFSAAMVAMLAGPSAWALETASTAHTGSLVSAGPTTSGSTGGLGGGTRGGTGPGGGGQEGGSKGFGSTDGSGSDSGRGTGGSPSGGMAGGPGGGSSMSQLLDASQPSAELISLLQTDAADYTWVAATVGSNSAAGLQLAVGFSVMPVGGFNGSDPSPSLAQFQELVAEGRIHYWIGGSGFSGQNGGSDASSEIASWVEENFESVTVGDSTVYDLTQPTTDTSTGTSTTDGSTTTSTSTTIGTGATTES